MRIIKASDYNDLSRKAANIIGAQVIQNPRSVLGLATGSTPLGTYRQLIERFETGDLDFLDVSSINLDEYVGLGPGDPQSYRYFMNHNLFMHINIKPENTHVPNGLEANEKAECARYENLISQNGGIDLQLLGIGLNGHIGFNEPGAEFVSSTNCVALTESTIQANSRFFADMSCVPTRAYTMGMRAIMHAARILIIVSGANKARIVKEAFYGPVVPAVPASILQLHPNVTLIGDAEALSLL